MILMIYLWMNGGVNDMARMIDADSLMKKFCVNSDGRRIPEVDCDNIQVTVPIKDIKKIIREQPIAYDVDKVVEEFCRYDASSIEELMQRARNKAIDDLVIQCKKVHARGLITNWGKPFGIEFDKLDEIAQQLKEGAFDGN